MASPIRVLCVDDEPDLAAVVAQFLNEAAEDTTAMTATDGEEALGILAKEDIDCVISDYHMPGMDGLELLETVRSTDPELPFILFTGRGSEDVAGKAVRAGVTDYIPKTTVTDQFELLENRIRNVVERHQARQTTRELFNAATDAIFIHDRETGTIIDVNEAGAELWGYNAEGLIGKHPSDLVVESERAEGWLPSNPAQAEPQDWRCEDANGHHFWAEVRVRSAQIEGEEQLLSICRDMTRRKGRERQLSDLLNAAEELVTHRSLEGIGDTLTRTMTETLGYSGAILYVGEDADGFEQVAQSGEVGNVNIESIDTDAIPDLSSDDELRQDGGMSMAAPIRSGSLYYWPIKETGILVGNYPEDHLSNFAKDLTELLAALGQAALVRSVQDQRLAAQHEELQSLNHVNEVIRDINQTLVKVSTRDEIEQLVCKQLATASPFVCAWIGEHDLTEERVYIRVAAGRGASEVQNDQIGTRDEDDDPLGGALTDLISDREVLILNDLSPETIGEERAKLAENHGFESLTIIPITYQNALYDMLAIFSETTEPFGDGERAVFHELGETIGYAMHTAERSRALLSNTTVELEYEIRDTNDILLGLSHEFETTVQLERIFFSADDSARLFILVEGETFPAIREYVKNVRTDADIREISDREDGTVVEIALESLSMMKHLAEAMATIRSVEAVEGEGRMVIEIPNAVSVRTLSENLSHVFDHVSLLARRQRDPEERGLSDVGEATELGLTDRQHEVLLTAYHAGFFSWPRGSTGEEIAELLDISQPTFHEHLRTGERKILELLFENRRSVYT